MLVNDLPRATVLKLLTAPPSIPYLELDWDAFEEQGKLSSADEFVKAVFSPLIRALAKHCGWDALVGNPHQPSLAATSVKRAVVEQLKAYLAAVYDYSPKQINSAFTD